MCRGALAYGLRRLRDLRPLRQCGRTPAPTPAGDYPPSRSLSLAGSASGYVSRLNRDLAYPFGSEGYAKEELRAEIASLMIGDALSIGHDPGQHAAYVGSLDQGPARGPQGDPARRAHAEQINRYVLALEKERGLAEREPSAPAIAQDAPERVPQRNRGRGR